MRRSLIKFILLFLFFPISVFASETYTLDPTHSYVEWHINHFGFSNPSGKWYVQGTIDLDKNKPQNSKVNITIPIANIETGLPELDQHLKGKDFFDADKYPTATFVSNKIDMTGKNSAKIHGILTLHGVSKPVVLNAKLNKAGVNPITNKDTVGFSATTKLDRSDYDMNTFVPNISDEVVINIEVEANK